MADEVLLQLPPDNSRWQEEHWSILLEHIEERTVIPVVGPDLLTVEVNGQSILLDHFLAAELARKYSIAAGQGASLNDVACALFQRDHQRDILYAAVHKICSETQIAPPRALVQLAEITHFNLFVTTTFDTLLEKAIKDVRKQEPKTIAYLPNNPRKDIALEDLHRPTVYHLLGKSSPLPYHYVVTEEDLLEFVHALQSESYRPRILFEELKNKNLLLLGQNFPDWLARFFLRAAKQARLSESSRVMEVLADSRLQTEKSLAVFLRNFSKNTRIFSGAEPRLVEPKTSPVEFVDELWRRWQASHPSGPVVQAKVAEEAMPAGAIFVSYARQDADAVHELQAGLSQAGLSVWFDKVRLGPGDIFEDKIRKNIRTCKCFLAVLSRQTEARRVGFFRREWSYALRRAPDFDHSRPFIVPVIVDDLKEPRAVPDFFNEVNYTWLPDGRVTPEFVQRLREIVSGD